MNPPVVAAIVGLLTLWIAFKVMKFAMKMAFVLALVVGGAAAYLAYLSS